MRMPGGLPRTLNMSCGLPALKDRICACGVMHEGMAGQDGSWMGAAKADEARRRMRTSAIAPPCVPLEGGATIICATPEGRAFERATQLGKSAKCRHCYTNSKCTPPKVLL